MNRLATREMKTFKTWVTGREREAGSPFYMELVLGRVLTVTILACSFT